MKKYRLISLFVFVFCFGLYLNFTTNHYDLLSLTIKEFITRDKGYLIENLDNYSSRDFITAVDTNGCYTGYLNGSDTIRVVGYLTDTCIHINKKTILFIGKPQMDEIKHFFPSNISNSFISYEIKWRPFWYIIELVYYDMHLENQEFIEDFPRFDIYVMPAFGENNKIIGLKSWSGWPHTGIGEFYKK